MKKELKLIYNINDEQELDEIINIIRNNSQKEIKNIFLVSIVIAIIFFAIISGTLIYFNNHSAPSVQTDSSGMGFLLLIFVSIIISIFFYFYRKSKYNNVGRTTISVPINNNINNEIMDKMLDDLYYKKINQDVYYAFKTRSSFINASSVKRYLSYKIDKNRLTIQVWKKYGAEEKPLNYGQIDRFINMASLYDLKVIVSNLPKVNND